jgi:hypothetical protein
MKPVPTTFAVGLLASALALALNAAPAAPSLRNLDATTKVQRAPPGRTLTLASPEAPSTIVSTWLRGKGHASATVNALRVVAQRVDRKGVRHVRMQQEVGGLAVHEAYVKAAVGKRGELLSVIDALAPLPTSGLKAATIDERTALARAYAAQRITGATPALVQRIGAETRFAKGKGFAEGPRVTRVAVPLADGSLQVGFRVETWRTAGNALVETLISGDGRVLEAVSRTAQDSYRVFTVDPDATPQTIVPGGDGWLFAGPHRSIDIAGNNVHAYLDATNDSVPDTGGTAVTNGNFLAVFDPAVQPSTPGNRDVAVQNLFYLNNVIHDRLYLAGFDEAAGNFQEDNFGAGGKDDDSVRAEAQDGGGTDNANFSTPRDGRQPRMQMYLWSSPEPDHQVVVNSPTPLAPMPARRAAFGGVLTPAAPLTDDLVVVDDNVVGAGTPPGTETDGCEPIANDVSGRIAVIDRGFCSFVIKVKNAQNAGAVGVVMVNNAGAPIVMGGEDATITIPALMVSTTDGATLKGLANANATMRIIDPPLIRRDGDLDSDIVWHEFGHGLTWRMIDRMDGPLSGAIGEGMADVLAVIVNDDDVVAEYSTGTPEGLRSEPYAAYSRTYGDIVGEEVHFDGEVYGAIGWRLWKNFQSAGASKDAVLAILVDGMNYTKTHPTYEDMRDGILAGLAGSRVADRCRVWEAFAHYGVGVGALGQVQGKKVLVSESFALPAECD